MTLEFSGKWLPRGQELGGSEQTTSLSLAAASSSGREGLRQAGEALLLQSLWLLWPAQGPGGSWGGNEVECSGPASSFELSLARCEAPRGPLLLAPASPSRASRCSQFIASAGTTHSVKWLLPGHTASERRCGLEARSQLSNLALEMVLLFSEP